MPTCNHLNLKLKFFCIFIVFNSGNLPPHGGLGNGLANTGCHTWLKGCVCALLTSSGHKAQQVKTPILCSIPLAVALDLAFTMPNAITPTEVRASIHFHCSLTHQYL